MIKRKSTKILAMEKRAILLETERLNFNFPNFFMSKQKIILAEQAGFLGNLVVGALSALASKGGYVKVGPNQVMKLSGFDPVSGKISGDIYNVIHGRIPGAGSKPSSKSVSMEYTRLLKQPTIEAISNNIGNLKTITDLANYFKGGKGVSFVDDLGAITSDFIEVFGEHGSLNQRNLTTALHTLRNNDIPAVFGELIESIGKPGSTIKGMEGLQKAFHKKLRSIAAFRNMSDKEIAQFGDNYIMQIESIPFFRERFKNVFKNAKVGEHFDLKHFRPKKGWETSGFFMHLDDIKPLLDGTADDATKAAFYSKFAAINERIPSQINRFFGEYILPTIKSGWIPFKRAFYERHLDLNYLYNNGYRTAAEIEKKLPGTALYLTHRFGDNWKKSIQGKNILEILNPNTRQSFLKNVDNQVEGWGIKSADEKVVDEFKRAFIWNIKMGIKNQYRSNSRIAQGILSGGLGWAFTLYCVIGMNIKDCYKNTLYVLFKLLHEGVEEEAIIKMMVMAVMKSDKDCIDSINRQYEIDTGSMKMVDATDENPDDKYDVYFNNHIKTNMDCAEAYEEAYHYVMTMMTDETFANLILQSDKVKEMISSGNLNIKKMLKQLNGSINMDDINANFDEINDVTN
jgi:hypothetical protein